MKHIVLIANTDDNLWRLNFTDVFLTFLDYGSGVGSEGKSSGLADENKCSFCCVICIGNVVLVFELLLELPIPVGS